MRASFLVLLIANTSLLPFRTTSLTSFSSLSPTKMSQVTVRRSFGELDLRDKLRSESDAVFHLFLGQNPLHPFLLRQVGKRAGVDFQSFLPGGPAAQTRFSPWWRRGVLV